MILDDESDVSTSSSRFARDRIAEFESLNQSYNDQIKKDKSEKTHEETPIKFFKDSPKKKINIHDLHFTNEIMESPLQINTIIKSDILMESPKMNILVKKSEDFKEYEFAPESERIQSGLDESDINLIIENVDEESILRASSNNLKNEENNQNNEEDNDFVKHTYNISNLKENKDNYKQKNKETEEKLDSNNVSPLLNIRTMSEEKLNSKLGMNVDLTNIISSENFLNEALYDAVKKLSSLEKDNDNQLNLNVTTTNLDSEYYEKELKSNSSRVSSMENFQQENRTSTTDDQKTSVNGDQFDKDNDSLKSKFQKPDLKEKILLNKENTSGIIERKDIFIAEQEEVPQAIFNEQEIDIKNLPTAQPSTQNSNILSPIQYSTVQINESQQDDEEEKLISPKKDFTENEDYELVESWEVGIIKNDKKNYIEPFNEINKSFENIEVEGVKEQYMQNKDNILEEVSSQKKFEITKEKENSETNLDKLKDNENISINDLTNAIMLPNINITFSESIENNVLSKEYLPQTNNEIKANSSKNKFEEPKIKYNNDDNDDEKLIENILNVEEKNLQFTEISSSPNKVEELDEFVLVDSEDNKTKKHDYLNKEFLSNVSNSPKKIVQHIQNDRYNESENLSNNSMNNELKNTTNIINKDLEKVNDQNLKEIQKDGLDYVDKIRRFSENFEDVLNDENEINNFEVVDNESIISENAQKQQIIGSEEEYEFVYKDDFDDFEKNKEKNFDEKLYDPELGIEDQENNLIKERENSEEEIKKDSNASFFNGSEKNKTHKIEDSFIITEESSSLLNNDKIEKLKDSDMKRKKNDEDILKDSNENEAVLKNISSYNEELQKLKDKSENITIEKTTNDKKIIIESIYEENNFSRKSSDDDFLEILKNSNNLKNEKEKSILITSNENKELAKKSSQEALNLKTAILVDNIFENLNIENQKIMDLEVDKINSLNQLLTTNLNFRPKSPIPPLLAQTLSKNHEGSSDSLNNESVESNSSNNSIKKLKNYEQLLTMNGDNVSVGSLQEFERLERELLQNENKQENEDSSPNEAEKANQNANGGSKTGSISSLIEFENLEQEVREAVGIAAAALAEDVMILSDIREESEEAEGAEEMSTHEDDDEENDRDSLSPKNVDKNIMLSSVDSLMGQQHLMEISADSLEIDLLQGHKKIREYNAMTDSLEDNETDTTFQEYQENKELDEETNLYPTTITTFQTSQTKEDGTTETITRQVKTLVKDPVHSHISFINLDSRENLPQGQQIRTIDKEGNITTTTYQKSIQ